MPNYRVRIDGHDYLVEVPDPSERPIRAIVEGTVLEVTIPSEPPESGRRGGASEEPSSEVVSRDPDVQSRGPKAVSTGGGLSTGGRVAVKAPLPGTIVSISVAVGESFDRGQELCVLEAMKMNNPIRAQHPGTVREILVSIGQQVQHSTILMVVEET